MLNDLQRECLKQMGITLWQRRTSGQRYLVISADQSPALTALLHKMLAALNWPLAETKVMANELPKDFAEFEKILVCGAMPAGLQPHAGQVCVTVPALSVLLNDVDAKKIAWKAMQTLL